MSKDVIVALDWWVFELNVTTNSIVGIPSFEEECSQQGDIVTPRNKKELEKGFKI